MRQSRQDIHDVLFRIGIQIPRGFIGDDDVRVMGEGAGDAHPLLLAAGELEYLAVGGFPVDPHPFQQLIGALFLIF